jgi:hypothetical protein
MLVEARLRNLPGPRHGMARHGKGMRAPIYIVWRAMLGRCENPNDASYFKYGGRGIKVCERWHTFEHFRDDMGPRPPRQSIERINNEGNYEPSNCRWATYYEQNANRRSTQKVFFRGEQIHLSEVARRIGIAAGNLSRYAKRYKKDLQATVDHYAAKYPDRFNAANITAGTQFPTVLLRIECAATNPPRPLGIGIFFEGKPIAKLELLEIRNTMRRLEELEAAYFAQRPPPQSELDKPRIPFKNGHSS